MALTETISDSLKRSFELYRELAESLDEPALSAKLSELPSNTIGEQLWCVVGARESYSRAITENKWSGFSCSLESTKDKTTVVEALEHSQAAVREVLQAIASYSDTQNRLAIDLLEHEVAHHGQLISVSLRPEANHSRWLEVEIRAGLTLQYAKPAFALQHIDSSEL